MRRLALFFILFWSVNLPAIADKPQDDTKTPVFNMETASRFAQLAYDCISTEYPNKIGHTMHSREEVGEPKQLHPAFFGCFDWHSSVHGHWLLVKLLKEFPELPHREEIIKAIDQNLSAENLLAEAEYCKHPGRASFERPYGWGWLLKLNAELMQWNDPIGDRWLENMEPLCEVIVSRFKEYLPGLHYPLRRGVHANTALGLSFAFDYARAKGDKDFEDLIVKRSCFYFLDDKKYPAAWEPDGDDFLSPSLTEAFLMQRVLSQKEFEKWFRKFMPKLPESLENPAIVANRKDPKGVHLDGLNLSRAWCMYSIAGKLPQSSKMREKIALAADRHATEALPHVISENYEGTHWLATFAIYMLVCKNEYELM